MDIQKRLFRRPVTTALWLVLVTVMAVFLCVGTALWYSSGNLANQLDGYHTAIAVRVDRGTTGTAIEGGAMWSGTDMTLRKAQVEWLESLDSVKAVRFHTLSGAYSPALSTVLGLKRSFGYWDDTISDVNESYDEMVIVGTVERILSVEENDLFYEDSTLYGVNMEVRIEQILLVHPDYPVMGDDNYDDLINVTVSVFGPKGQEAVKYLKKGGRYLFGGRYDPQQTGTTDAAIPSIHACLHSSCDTMLSDGMLWGYWLEDGEPQKNRPAVQSLEGSVEDFLADPANAHWVQYIEAQHLVQQSLPVLGTDSLESMYVFVKNEAIITQGRSFTQEEYEAGSRVCILSETVALKSGIQVGDTIPVSQFLCETEVNGSMITYDPEGKLNNPTIGEWLPQEALAQQEEFTVVGLYRQTNEWEEGSYSFTPNTMFIPKKAQIEGAFGGMTRDVDRVHTMPNGSTITVQEWEEGGTFGVYLSVELRNGHVEDFKKAVAGSELAGQFHTFDQGYENAQQSINAVADSAEKLLAMALAGWALILCLYILLYQMMQQRNLGTMRSLGASPGAVRRYLFASGLILAAVGILLGTAVSSWIFGKVHQQMLATNEAVMSLHSGGVALDVGTMVTEGRIPASLLLILAAAQIGAFALVLWIQAAVLAKQPPRKLMRV